MCRVKIWTGGFQTELRQSDGNVTFLIIRGEMNVDDKKIGIPELLFLLSY
jgi:hypothetical protein